MQVGDDEKETPIAFTIRSADASDKDLSEKWKESNVLVLQPKAPLKEGVTCKVEIAQGLKAKTGDLGTIEGTEFTFSTMNIFGFEKGSVPEKIQPDEPVAIGFTNPVSYKGLAQNITFSPAVKVPDCYDDYDYETPAPELYLKFNAQTTYTVTISKNLKDMFGNSLPRDETFTFRTTDFTPAVCLTSGTGVVESKSRKQLPVSFMNVSRVKLQMAKVDKNKVISMIDGEAMEYDKEYKPGPSFFAVDKMWKNNAPRNEECYLPIELKEALGSQESGFVFVQLDDLLDPGHNQYHNHCQKAFIQVTNLGITSKFSPENGMVWVTELNSTRPVAGADVELRSDSNKVVWRGKTDEKGIAVTKGRSELGIASGSRWTRTTIWVFASKGKDCAFINSSWGWEISPYSFNLDYDYDNVNKEYKGGALYRERTLQARRPCEGQGGFQRKEARHVDNPFAEEADTESHRFPQCPGI